MNISTNSTSGSDVNVAIADVIIIVIYLILCLVVGLWAAYRTQKGSVSGYFLAGRDIPWFAVGASIFSSDFGTGSVLGMAGTGAATGIAVASYELNGVFCVLLLGWLFVPVFIACGAYTIPEYLKKRFGGQRLQVYMAVLSLLLAIFTKLTSDIYAGALFIKQAIGWNMYVGVVVLLAITAIYTIIGGLKAVIYTDTLQTIVLLVGCSVLTALGFHQVGGMRMLYEKYMLAVPSTLLNQSECGLPRSDSFHLLRDARTGDLPWPGNVFGISILGTWYFCTDQVMVQRSLAAKNMHHVKGGSIFASYLKLLPLYIIIFPGMISRVLYPDEVACVDPDICQEVCGNPSGCFNIAYPKLILEILPTGLKGLMLAGMLAFLMSTLTSVFNSASTIATIDLWKRIRPAASDAELLVCGRVFVLVMVGISIVWLPVLQSAQGGLLFNYIQSMTGYLSPPVLAVFLLAITWNRTTEPGAFWGLMVGLVTGIIRMGLDFGYGSPACWEPDTRPAILAHVHFLHFTILLFFISAFTTVTVSLLTKPVDATRLERLTWWTRHDVIKDTLGQLHIEEANVDQHSNQNQTPSQDVSRLKRLVYVLCGYEKSGEGQGRTVVSAMERLKQLRKFTSIQEDPRWKRVVDFNAIILLMITMFLWGFYA